MTFKEKLAMEHPDKICPCVEGGCIGCPGDYGYEFSHECRDDCYDCWNREIPGTSADIGNLTALIDRVASRRDISVSIFIHGETISISVYPYPDPADEPKNPTAEAYKNLLNGNTVEALAYLEEALAE